uniref:Uncharacterized protein n=1 Tax=Salix viminalis TaxID=40686 RepID=A0A6N2N5B6_SALVM
MAVGDRIRNATSEDIDLEKGNGDLENDGLPNFIDDHSNMVVDVHVANSSSNPNNSGKRKAFQ